MNRQIIFSLFCDCVLFLFLLAWNNLKKWGATKNRIGIVDCFY